MLPSKKLYPVVSQLLIYAFSVLVTAKLLNLPQFEELLCLALITELAREEAGPSAEFLTGSLLPALSTLLGSDLARHAGASLTCDPCRISLLRYRARHAGGGGQARLSPAQHPQVRRGCWPCCHSARCSGRCWRGGGTYTGTWSRSWRSTGPSQSGASCILFGDLQIFLPFTPVRVLKCLILDFRV